MKHSPRQSKQPILQKPDGGTPDWFAYFVPKLILKTANALHSAFDGCLEDFYSKGSLTFICFWKIRLHYHPTLMNLLCRLAYPTEIVAKLNSLYWNLPAHGNKVSIEDQVFWSIGNCFNDKDEWKLEIWQHFLQSWISARKDKDGRPAGTQPNGMQHMENLSWQFVLYFHSFTHKTQRWKWVCFSTI
jgi:hypothetical protein